MSFKTLHSFVITLKQEVTETTTREENGQTITTATKVERDVPHTIVLKEPSRREKQELALFQGVMYNEAITKGLLPRLVMQQKIVKEMTTPISEAEDKNLIAMNKRLQELIAEYIHLSGLDSLTNETEEKRERKEKILSEYMGLQKKVIEMNGAYQSVFAHTAENYMQVKTLTWLTLFLTYLKTEDKYESFFAGSDFSSKENKLSDMEDDKDPLYFKALEKLPTYWMLYLFDRASKPEDFVRVEAEMLKQADAEEKMKKEIEQADKNMWNADPTKVSAEQPPIPPKDSPTEPSDGGVPV